MMLVKLGGSVLTNKGTRGPAVFRRIVARRLLRDLARAAKQQSIVLVHGAGSFGHPAALRHKIGRRLLAGPALHRAITETSRGVRQLRTSMLNEARLAGLRVADLPTSALAYAKGRDIYFDAGIVARYADAGFVPMLSGDVILDAARGARVLSGDDLLALLAPSLRPERVLFVTDVDGLLGQDGLVQEIGAAKAKKASARLESRRDATGGMAAKVAAAARIAAEGVPVQILNGLARRRLRDALAGRPIRGTLVQPSAPGRRKRANQV